MMATSTYAKLVVLSYSFNTDTQGFTASIQPNGTFRPNCSASTSWGSDGTLQITISAAATGCGGSVNLVIDKLVVLSSSIQNPSTDMVIRDDHGLLNLSGGSAILSTIQPDKKLVVLSSGSGTDANWTTLSGAWGAAVNSGSADLQMVIPLNGGSWSTPLVVKADNINLYSN